MSVNTRRMKFNLCLYLKTAQSLVVMLLNKKKVIKKSVKKRTGGIKFKLRNIQIKHDYHDPLIPLFIAIGYKSQL
jgi:hypothetical protein